MFRTKRLHELVLDKVVGFEVELKHGLGGVVKMLIDLVVLVLDLGGEVIPDVPEVGDVVLDHQGDIRGHGERHLGGQARGLGEHVKVPVTRVRYGEMIIYI